MEPREDGLVFANELRAIKVTGAPKTLARITKCVHGLDGDHPTTEPAGELVDQLCRIGCLAPAADQSGVLDRSSRQVAFMSCFSQDPAGAQARVENSKVLLLGLGGTGSVFLQHMVAMGVRRFVLVDEDRVDISNLNRQFIYTLADCGRPKVDAAEAYVRSRTADADIWTHFVQISARSDLAFLNSHADVDLAFIGIDRPVAIAAAMVSAELAERGMPFLHTGVGIHKIRPGRVSTEALPAAERTSGTKASLATTNTLSTALAAHRAMEYLSNTSIPFEQIEAE